MEIEKCRLCGTQENISYEHVPPKSCYNRNVRYTKVPFLEYIQKDKLLDEKQKLKIEQGGVGFYSLCKKCNTDLGTNYVKAYSIFIKCMAKIAFKNDNNYFVVDIKELELLKILKQIVSMFLSINDYQFSRTFIELVDFVNSPESNDLPEKFRIFCYLNSEGSLRHLPLGVEGNFISNISIACSEICFPPFGCVLTIDFNGKIDGLTEITNFKNCPLDKKSNLSLGIYKLPAISPFHLDYRGKEQIESERNEIS